MRSPKLLLTLLFSFSLAACSGGGGGGGGGTGGSTLLQGSLRSNAAGARLLGAGEGGIPGVTVSALSGSTVTDTNGNFTFGVGSGGLTGEPIAFLFEGPGISTSVVLEGIAAEPDSTTAVEFVLRGSGQVTGQAVDAAGNVLASTAGGGITCDVIEDFVDTPFAGTLWKPISESTGRPVALMPPEYRHAEMKVVNVNGDTVDGPVRRSCCDHNGGREHVFISRRATDLALTGIPLTVVWTFPNGVVDCRTVPDPRVRYD